MIAAIDGTLALVALTIAPILFASSQAYRKRMRGQWREVKDLESSAYAVLQESLGAVRVVRS